MKNPHHDHDLSPLHTGLLLPGDQIAAHDHDLDLNVRIHVLCSLHLSPASFPLWILCWQL